MPRLLSAARSAASVLGIVLWLLLFGVPVLHLLVIPATWVFRSRRLAWVSAYMKLMSNGIFALLRLGGAHFTRNGVLPTESPILIVMNHQSLVDILTGIVMARADVPAFVTRRRYAYGIPVISPCVRLVGSPVIDPKRARLTAIGLIEQTARENARSFLIFPEGHRSPDGRLLPFKSAGVQAVLRGRRMPVYLVVTDGASTARRFVDIVFNVDGLRGHSEVLGPFEPPADAEVGEFVSGLREQMAARLAARRETYRAAV
jgi:1-acyl-sn-glycerol-3-phosphate acyltransferase